MHEYGALSDHDKDTYEYNLVELRGENLAVHDRVKETTTDSSFPHIVPYSPCLVDAV